MSTTVVAAPTSLVRFGRARVNITPPVGIYHVLWGAAKHHQATGIHRPLLGDVMAFAPQEGAKRPRLRASLDLCGLTQTQHVALQQAMAEASGLPADDVVLTYTHTHSSGWFAPDRYNLPGGDLIVPYLSELTTKMQVACREALASMQKVAITYATGRCAMAANRDYWDDKDGLYACGFNPDALADDTMVVGRVSDLSGRVVATVVNYACHPTSLGYPNTLLSPDYIGAAREVVEAATGVPCVYLQGACGDLGPRDGFRGDIAVADRNGRQVGYAALSALEAMGPVETDFTFDGYVISGATLGIWTHAPLTDKRRAEASRFAGGSYSVDLPLKNLRDRDMLAAELTDWQVKQREAAERGDLVAARDCGARAERARRWLQRLAQLPTGRTYPLRYSVHLMGDAVWVTSGGEPFNQLQRELRWRFPDVTVLVSPLAGDDPVAYIVPADRFGQGLYQEEPSPLAQGSLEMLIDAISERMGRLLRP